jgi:predicted dehydrogenase
MASDSRRDFIKKAVAGTVGLTVGGNLMGTSAKSYSSIIGATKMLNIAIVGCNSRGASMAGTFASQPDTFIKYVCDVDEKALQKGIKAVQKVTGKELIGIKDFRKVLDDKDLHALYIATPDHWHALQTVTACQAGKDVYVEKPTATTVEESRLMVEAAQKYNRVVQVGTHRRSSIHYAKAREVVQKGFIGKVSYVRTWMFTNIFPEGIGNPPDSDPPPDLDWEMWLGPAPKVPYNYNRFGVGDRWSTFRYFWDYAGGDLTDTGVHFIDVAQWFMGVGTPQAITCSGGKFCLRDNAETPDTIQANFEYPSFVCTFESRFCTGNALNGKLYGMVFYGTDGTLLVDDVGFQVAPEKRRLGNRTVDRTAVMEMNQVNTGHVEHVRNFLDCVKSRQKPNADIAISQPSSVTCLLGNVAYRAESRLVWDGATQKLIKAGPIADRLLGREYRAPWKLKSEGAQR